MRKLSQSEKVLAHLIEHGKITQAEATDLYRCYRLAAIIWNLKHRCGLNIRTDITPNSGSRGVHGVYVLSDEDREIYRPWKEYIYA